MSKKKKNTRTLSSKPKKNLVWPIAVGQLNWSFCPGCINRKLLLQKEMHTHYFNYTDIEMLTASCVGFLKAEYINSAARGLLIKTRTKILLTLHFVRFIIMGLSLKRLQKDTAVQGCSTKLLEGIRSHCSPQWNSTMVRIWVKK